MFSSKFSKWLFIFLLALLAIASGMRVRAPQHLLRWGLQAYLGELLQGRVTIGDLRGGFFSGTTLINTRLFKKDSPLPVLAVDEIISDFRLLGKLPNTRNCVLTRPQFFLRECASSLGDFSLPLQRRLLLLPRSEFWRSASFSLSDGIVLESVHRQDNVLLRDIVGSLRPLKNQMLEMFLGTVKTAGGPNQLTAYGNVHLARGASNLDVELDLSRLESLNLFLRNVHVLKGSARVQATVRSANLENIQLRFQNVDLFFPKDRRILGKLTGTLSANSQYVRLRECSGQSDTMRFDLAGEAQRLAFSKGRVDIQHASIQCNLHSETLSAQPLPVDAEMSITLFYRHPDSITHLEWDKEMVDSLSLLEGKMRLNRVVELEFSGKYLPGEPCVFDYRATALDFGKIRKEWFGDTLNHVLRDVRILGEGRARCQWDRVSLDGALDWNEHKMAYRFTWAKRSLQVEELRVNEATMLEGILDLDHRDKSHLTLHFQDESITRCARALGSGKEPSLTGKFTGKIDFLGDLQAPDIQGDLDLRNGTVKGIPFKQGQIHLAGHYPKISLDHSVIFLQRNMPVALGGYVDLSLGDDMFRHITSDVKSSQGLAA